MIAVSLFVESHAVLHAGTAAVFDIDSKQFAGVIGVVKQRPYLLSGRVGQDYWRFSQLGGHIHASTLNLPASAVNLVSDARIVASRLAA